MLPKPGILHYRTFFALVFFSLTVIFINSCKKADTLIADTKISSNEIAKENTPENFLKLPANAAPVLHRIANELERQNKVKEFITAFIKKEGFPIWHKARIVTQKRKTKNNTAAGFDGEGLEDTTVYIPLVVNAQQYVHGFLKATVADTVQIEIFRQNDYNNFPFQTPALSSEITTAEKFALGMMLMDKDVFGSREFKIEDRRLFHNNTNYNDTAGLLLFVKIDSANGEGSFFGGGSVNNLFPECFTLERHTPCENFSGTNSVVGNCYTVSYSTLCPPWSGDEETGGWPITYSGGGSGGSGNPPGGGSPCGSFGASMVNGFIPIECEPGPGGNPWPSVEMLDLQWIEENVKDSTNDPCIINALTTLKQISPKLPKLIRDFFGVSPSFKIDLNTYVNASPSCSGNSFCQPPGAYTAPNPINNTYSIYINKYYSQATDLSTAVTIMHETLHAQLIHWLREATILQDTARQHQLAELFGYVFTPDFSNNVNVYNTAIQVTPQHDAMVALYRNLIGEALHVFAQNKGINISLTDCQKLAWAGLNTTEGFIKLSTINKEVITSMINAERDPNGINVNSDINGNPLRIAFGNTCY